MAVRNEQLTELLYQALETEIGGVQVYRTALRCAANKELRDEWREYLEQTEEHERILRDVFDKLGLDPERRTPGREVVHHKGQALVRAMEMALSSGNSGAAQLVAAESVVEAETKDHQNWELIGALLDGIDRQQAAVLRRAHEKVEDEEDEHLYHTMGWARELWKESLGLPAQLPPPEEEQNVKTMADAARVKKAAERKSKARTRAAAPAKRRAAASRSAAPRRAAASRGRRASAARARSRSGSSTRTARSRTRQGRR
jgi:rubrerythrin